MVIGRVLVTGNERTKEAAILRAVTLRSGQLLRSADIYTSEQNLYATDVFSNVEIKPQPAGERPDGTRIRDVIVSVTEVRTVWRRFFNRLWFSGFSMAILI